MKNKLQLIALLGVLFWAISFRANGATNAAQVVLRGTFDSQIELKVVGASGGLAKNPATSGADGPKIILSFYQARETWTKGSLTFVPSNTGKVLLTLQGPYDPEEENPNKLKTIFVDFDDVVADGDEIKNPSFEQTDSDSEPKGWQRNKPTIPTPEALKARLMQGDAAEGRNFIRVWHNSFYSQSINVTKDQVITISFKYRLAPEK